MHVLHVHQRHSPVIIGIAVVCLFLTSGVYIARGQQYTSPEEEYASYEYRQCMMQVLDEHERVTLAAHQQYHRAFEDALQRRWQERRALWEILDEDTRDSYVRQLDKEFNRYAKDLREEKEGLVDDADDVYRDGRRWCDDQLQQRQDDLYRMQQNIPAAQAAGGVSYEGWFTLQQARQQYVPVEGYYDSASSQVPFHSGVPVCGDGICEADEYACVPDCQAYGGDDFTLCGGYMPGQSFLAPDGCNQCACTENGIVCTLMACSQRSTDVQGGYHPYPIAADPVCVNGVCYQVYDQRTAY